MADIFCFDLQYDLFQANHPILPTLMFYMPQKDWQEYYQGAICFSPNLSTHLCSLNQANGQIYVLLQKNKKCLFCISSQANRPNLPNLYPHTLFVDWME